MAKVFRVGSSGLPSIPAGDYTATFSGWTLKTLQFGESIQLDFTINDDKFEGTVVSALAKANITPNTKLGNFVASFMDKSLQVDADIDLDAFIGIQGLVKVETKLSAKGNYSVVTSFQKKGDA